MSTSSHPRVFGQLLAAKNLVQPDPFRLLITGQIGDDGLATDGATYQDVESLTDAEVISLFGSKGELLGRILKARDKCQQRYSIWVIAKSPVAGTAASLELLYGGTATESRIMTVRPISQDQYSFDVAVELGDTAADVATKVKAGLDALVSSFPVANALATATLTLTANDSGTIGNKFSVQHVNIPAGITVNANATGSRDQFASGATDPTLTGIFDNVTSTRFHSISWPWEADFSEVQDFLEARNVINNSFLHGVAFIGYSDTEANISAKLNGVTPENSPNLFFMGNRNVDGADAIVEPDDWIAVEFAAVEGLRLTDGVPIGQYVTTSAPLDTIGGGGTSSLGYYNTPLSSTAATDPDLLFDEQEQQNLNADGFTIVGVNDSATSTIMGEVVSTYKFNGLGQPDTSFKYLNYIRTGYLALEIYFKTLKADYSQSRLTEGNVVPGRAMANKETIEAKYTNIFQLLGGPDFVLVQSGAEAEKFFYRELSITLDLASGEITSSGQLPIVTQAREFNMTFQMAFTVGG